MFSGDINQSKLEIGETNYTHHIFLIVESESSILKILMK